jgi:hypothetical protein
LYKDSRRVVRVRSKYAVYYIRYYRGVDRERVGIGASKVVSVYKLSRF